MGIKSYNTLTSTGAGISKSLSYPSTYDAGIWSSLKPPVSGYSMWVSADHIAGENKIPKREGWIDGDEISSIEDFGSFGMVFTAAGKPIWKVGIFGDAPVMRFDGDDLLSDTNTQTRAANFTVFLVGAITDITGPIQTFFQFASPFVGDNQWGRVLANRSVDGQLEYMFIEAGDLVSYGSTTNAVIADNTPFYCMNKYVDGDTECSYRVDGADEAVTPVLSDGDHNDDADSGAMIGASDIDGPGFLVGDIAEILVYSSALAGGDITAVEAYFAAKYGI